MNSSEWHDNPRKRTFVGSVSHYCVQHATVPVVVVPVVVVPGTSATSRIAGDQRFAQAVR
jgi:Universal stress protein family